MQKTQSKRNNKKVVLLTAISVLLAAVLVLSGVGIYLKVTHKEKPAAEVNPLDFSIDTWNGSVNATNFNENYAGRGSLTKTINSASSFAHFVSEVNNGNSFENYTIYLNSSIDLKGQVISSIGTSEKPFKGIFDGGYYTIYNANVNGNGLFGYTENATIKNVGLYKGNTNLIDIAVNTNIENTFVRFGNGRLVNEYISNNGNHYINNSFVDSSINGLINKLDTNNSSENEVAISNCYYTQGENAIVENVGTTFVNTEENVIKATNKSQFNNWNYSAEYATDVEWCDYDYLDGSQKLDFVYPVQAGFVKVYLTGSCYESVMIAGDTVVDTANLAEAFTEADREAEAEVNLLVEKIFMEARAEVKNSNVTVNAVKDTTIVRGENNLDSMFVGNGSSKIVLGAEQGVSTASGASAEQATLTLDGNREYVEANNLESGALIVANGGEIEIHDNVVIKDNVNNTVGYGGAVIIDNAQEDVKICARFENCASTNGGGAVTVINNVEEQNILVGSFKNCTTTGNGGAMYLAEELPAEATQQMRALYGKNNTIRATEDYIERRTDVTSVGDDTYTNCSATGTEADGYGGAIYNGSSSITLTISGTATFKGNTANNGGAIYTEGTVTISGEAMFTGNKATSGRGGAISVGYYGKITIAGEATFESNTANAVDATYGGGAIYTRGTLTISAGAKATFKGNTITGTYAYGGAISGDVTIDGEATFTDNTATGTYAYGGAIYGTVIISAGATAMFEGNTASYGGAIDGDVTISAGATAEFTGNTATDGSGGAIWASVNEKVTIDGKATFTGNTAGFSGGAIDSVGTVTINGEATFKGGNTAGSGGAIYVSGSSATVTISGTAIFGGEAEGEGNTAGKDGGAIAGTVIINAGATATFTGNQSQGTNSTYGGGAIWATRGVTIDGEATFTNNTATVYGGAIYISSSSRTVTISAGATVEFIGNTGLSGGAIYTNGTVTINGEATFKGNTANNYGGAIDASGTVTINGNVTLDDNCDTTKTTSSQEEIYAKGTLTLGADLNVLSDSGCVAIRLESSNYITVTAQLTKSVTVYKASAAAFTGSNTQSYIFEDTTTSGLTGVTDTFPFEVVNMPSGAWIDYDNLKAKFGVLALYTITWKNWDGTVLETDMGLVSGKKPTYNGATPTRESTELYNYIFSGWTPTITAVTADTTYTATYTSSARSYTITYDYAGGNSIATGLEEVSGVTYGFTQLDTGYFESTNKGIASSYSLTKFNFTATATSVDFDVINYAESNYDYGIFSNVNTTLTLNSTADSTNVFKSFKGSSKSTAQTLTYTDLTIGTDYYIYVKFVKDGLGNSYNDSVQFKISSGAVYNPTTYFTTSPAITLANPTRDRYTFTGWTGSNGTTPSTNVTIPSGSTGNKTYTANWELITYTITWKNDDGTTLTTTSVNYGSTPSYTGTTPTKASTAQYTYTFSGWTPTITSVTGDATYTATYTSTVRSYTITWKNDDGTTLTTSTVNYGSTPSYTGTTPTKASTAQYTYTFSGWTPTITNVTGDATYTATYTSTLISYTITWKNDDGTTLKTTTVNYGSTPSYGGTPTKAATAQYTYTFSGWTPTITSVTEDATYTATYESIANSYTITYHLNYEDRIYAEITYKYGEIIVLPEKPTRSNYLFGGWYFDQAFTDELTSFDAMQAQDNIVYAKWVINAFTVEVNLNYNGAVNYTKSFEVNEFIILGTPIRTGYTFKGWYYNQELTNNLEDGAKMPNHDISVFASWEIETYTVTWLNDDGQVLETDENVEYGTMPTYNGEEPTKTATAQYTYTFKAWTPIITSVTGEATYTATYRSTLRSYTITWKNWDGTVLQIDSVVYGLTPSYSGTPTKATTAQYTYTFNGWTPTITSVTGEATYTAAYTSTLRSYTITWKNDDGSTLTISTVAYGSTPSYTGGTPTKASTPQYTYTFSGWTPTITSVAENTTYTATYIQEVRKYTITISVNNSNYGSVNSKQEIVLLVEYGKIITIENNVLTIGNEEIVATPASGAPEGYKCAFSNWEGASDMVGGDMTITANFIQKPKSYTITIETNNANGTVSIIEFDAEFGSEIYVVDNILTIGNYHVVAVPNESDAQYEYTFTGWSNNATGTVSGDMTITANFSKTIKVYTITMSVISSTMGQLSTTDTTINVSYGTKITIEDDTLIIGEGAMATTITAIANQGYSFEKWVGVVGLVEGNITIMAQFA